MNITSILDHQWDDVRSTYLEAFPKAERKPFFTVRRSVKKGKAKIYTASENNTLLGFVMVIPYKNLVMVDYLAVSGKVTQQRNRKSFNTGNVPSFQRPENHSSDRTVG